jgi:hypothetical protein
VLIFVTETQIVPPEKRSLLHTSKTPEILVSLQEVAIPKWIPLTSTGARTFLQVIGIGASLRQQAAMLEHWGAGRESRGEAAAKGFREF